MAAVLGFRCRVNIWQRYVNTLPSRWASSSRNRLRKIMQENLETIKAAGTWKTERIIISPQAACIKVDGQDSGVLNFCANNYLGLAVRLMFTTTVDLLCMQLSGRFHSAHAFSVVTPTGHNGWSACSGKQRSRAQLSPIHLWHSGTWFSVACVHVARLVLGSYYVCS